MFEKFGDYMFYLLTAPIKKKKSGKNQFHIFFSVVGKIFDGILEDVFKFRRQKMISTAEPAMLELIGRDRDMYQLQGESEEQYRLRLQMKAIIAEMAGTNTGLIMVLQLLGYPECSVEPLYKTDRSRWAEIYIDILVLRDINYGAILHETLKVKPARTLPIFRFFYRPEQINIKTVAVGGIGCCIKVKARLAESVKTNADDYMAATLRLSQYIKVTGHDIIEENDVYILTAEGRKVRVLSESGRIVSIAP